MATTFSGSAYLRILGAMTVKPGGWLASYDPSATGYAVTNTTADILQIANSSSGSSVDYDIIVIGEV